MLALFDFEPQFCPACGRPAAHRLNGKNGSGTFRYRLRESFVCACGLRYQNAKTSSILNAARESEGNLMDPHAARSQDGEAFNANERARSLHSSQLARTKKKAA